MDDRRKVSPGSHWRRLPGYSSSFAPREVGPSPLARRNLLEGRLQASPTALHHFPPPNGHGLCPVPRAVPSSPVSRFRRSLALFLPMSPSATEPRMEHVASWVSSCRRPPLLGGDADPAARPTADLGRHVNWKDDRVGCPRGTGQSRSLCQDSRGRARMCHARLAAPAGEERGRRRREDTSNERESQGPRLRRVELWSRKGAGEQGSRVQARGGEERWNPSPPPPGLAPAGQWPTGHWAVGSHQWTVGDASECGQVQVGESASGE